MKRLLVPGVLLLCGFSFFVRSDRPGLLEKDEPRYAVPAREMARGGDWLVPLYNGRERLVKPPGTYWAMAAAFRATGSFDEASARLPSAVAATLAVLLAAWAARRALGTLGAAAAAVVLATGFQFLVHGRLATTDMLFTLLFAAAAGCWLPVLEGSARAGPWILASGLAAGGAALVKTPLALPLPAAAAVLAALLLRRLGGPEALPPAFRAGNRGRTALWFAGAAVLMAGAFLAWLLPASAATEGRAWSVLTAEAGDRFRDGEGHHRAGPFYYVPVVLGGLVPWVCLLPAGVRSALRRAAEGGKKAALPAFALALAATVVVFFSLLPSKLTGYVLPAAPALAILCAFAAEDLHTGAQPPWVRSLAGWGTILLGVAALVAPGTDAVRDALGDAGPEGTFALAVVGGLLLLGGAAILQWRIGAFLAAGAAATLSLLATAGPVLPRLEAERCGRAAARAMLDRGIRAKDEVYDVTNHITGVLWYADRGTLTSPDGTAPEERRVVEAFAEGRPAWAIVKHDPDRARAAGRKTQWEAMKERIPPDAPTVLVVWRGMDRLIVTNAAR